MFSGIVENSAKVIDGFYRQDILEIEVARPTEFVDLKLGDSVAVNGVCLTVEKLTDKSMFFAVGLETIKVTQWTREVLMNQPVNLERSLKWSDRIHGHLMAGHVDGVGVVRSVQDIGENRLLMIQCPQIFLPLIWKKGSVSINGVSLTINEVEGDCFGVGLIPETLRRTNLKYLVAGDLINLEADSMARGLRRQFELARGEQCL